MTRTSERADAIVLADEPRFRLGVLEVRPATREIVAPGTTATLEPRIMQVLVALARADGEVVSHDELIARAWDGRIVGDNAIHRAIPRIRALAVGPGAGSFALATIPKVGYRLIARGASTSPTEQAPRPFPPPRPEVREQAAAHTLALAPPATAASTPLPRRVVLGGGLAVLAGVAGLFVQTSSDNADIPALAVSDSAAGLIAEAREAMWECLPTSAVQAEAYLTRATELAPGSAEAWGARALVEAQIALQFEDHDRLAWATKAARRALALDPGNSDAAAALLSARPTYRRWAAKEAALRAALRRHPEKPRPRLDARPPPGAGRTVARRARRRSSPGRARAAFRGGACGADLGALGSGRPDRLRSGVRPCARTVARPRLALGTAVHPSGARRPRFQGPRACKRSQRASGREPAPGSATFRDVRRGGAGARKARPRKRRGRHQCRSAHARAGPSA